MGNTQPPRLKEVLQLPELSEDLFGLASPVIPRPLPPPSSVSPDAGRPLLMFGDFKTGKSWFIKHLLKQLGIIVDVPTGEGDNNITHACKLYEAEVEGEVWGFVDTEGLGRQYRAPPPDRAYHAFPLVLSVILRIPGNIVLVTRGAISDTDAVLLQLATGLVSRERKVFVVHNFQHQSVDKIDDVVTLLTRPAPEDGLLISGTNGNNLVSYVHGHQIRHLIYLKESDSRNIPHNTSVRELLLQSTRYTTPRIDLRNTLEINVHSEYMQFQYCNVFEYEFATEIGFVKVQFRRLLDDELCPARYAAEWQALAAERRAQDDPELFTRLAAIRERMPEQPDTMVGVLGISGCKLDLYRTRVCPRSAYQLVNVMDPFRNFVFIDLFGFPRARNNQPRAKIQAWIPRPMEGGEPIGQVVREGELLVFIRLSYPGLTALPARFERAASPALPDKTAANVDNDPLNQERMELNVALARSIRDQASAWQEEQRSISDEAVGEEKDDQ